MQIIRRSQKIIHKKKYQVPKKVKTTYAVRKTNTLTPELKPRKGISCRPAGPQ